MEEKETFIMIDENGNEKEAEIITIIEIDNKEYVIYAVNKNEESDNIFASRIIKDENGNDVIKSIENQEEKKWEYIPLWYNSTTSLKKLVKKYE